MSRPTSSPHGPFPLAGFTSVFAAERFEPGGARSEVHLSRAPLETTRARSEF